MREKGFRLYEMPGWGSAIVELQLVEYGLPVELIRAGDVMQDEAARTELGRINPRAQLPTLILPSGEVMTESAAISLYLADVTGRDILVPGPEAPERAAFLRWLIFIVANIYPTFTYGDIPTRFVDDDRAAAGFLTRLQAQAKQLWLEVAAAADGKGPWFLGQRYSAIDIFIAVMVRWKPGTGWFRQEAPVLWRIAEAVWQKPALQPVFARNFGQAIPA